VTAGRVVTLGSINVDVLAALERLPVAGETVVGNSLTRQLGGKGANQAVAAARAGARSVLLSAVGEDGEGAGMVEALSTFGVDVSAIRTVPGATGHAIVLTSSSDNQIVVIPGANALVDHGLASQVRWAKGDVALAQMETPPTVIAAFLSHARRAGVTTLLNAAPANNDVPALLPLTDVLIVNESELALLSGQPLGTVASDASLENAITESDLSSVATIIVTLGANGAAVWHRRTLVRIAGHSVKVVDTTGAGDCFCGYLAAALARGDALETAIVEANIAAAMAVRSLGAASAMPPRSLVLSVANAAQEKV